MLNMTLYYQQNKDKILSAAREREKNKYKNDPEYKQKKIIAMKLYRDRINQDETLAEKKKAYQKEYQKAYQKEYRLKKKPNEKPPIKEYKEKKKAYQKEYNEMLKEKLDQLKKEYNILTENSNG